MKKDTMEMTSAQGSYLAVDQVSNHVRRIPCLAQIIHPACSHPFRLFGISLLSVCLMACTTAGQAKKTDAAEAASDKKSTSALSALHAPPDLDTKLVGAVTSPLVDFNLMRAEIYPSLLAAIKGPYLLPLDKSCEAIALEVTALDLAIGPDLDAPVSPTDPDLLDRGTTELSNAAVGALRRTVEGTIPFRSWIRKFSGAEKHSRELTSAVAAGIVRRSFLKGLGQASGCHAPAAPRSLQVSND